MVKPLTEGKTLGGMSSKAPKGESRRPPPTYKPKTVPRIKEVYCLKWKQSGRVTVPEFFTDKAEAQRYADACNKTLKLNHIQKMLGRYWFVETFKKRTY
jgi:hypothetical protein